MELAGAEVETVSIDPADDLQTQVIVVLHFNFSEAKMASFAVISAHVWNKLLYLPTRHLPNPLTGDRQ